MSCTNHPAQDNLHTFLNVAQLCASTVDDAILTTKFLMCTLLEFNSFVPAH
jgi:hypothetical protein